MSREVRLRAFAPGIILHALDALTGLERGKSYELDEPVIAAAVAVGRVAFIDTGSPELDYVLRFAQGAPPPALAKAAAGSVTFPFAVSGGGIAVRDGYATEKWDGPGYACERLAFPDGSYEVEALWIASRKHGEMVIELFFAPASAMPKKCSGWLELDYVSPEDDPSAP